jgi:hypothetical protein
LISSLPPRTIHDFSVPLRNDRYFSASASSIRDDEKDDFTSIVATRNEDPFQQAVAELPEGGQIHLDFFREPVTFFQNPVTCSGDVLSRQPDIASAIAALDGFLIGIVSKGKAFTGGGEEDGVRVQAAHSSAMAWAEMIRHCAVWNNNGDESSNLPTTAAPMLIYVTVAPVLAQAGVAYLYHLDHLLQQVDSKVQDYPNISLVRLTERAIEMLHDDEDPSVPLTSRERVHLQVLDCLFHPQTYPDGHGRAMMILYRHLQKCPGDALALSLLMDICHTVGNTDIPLRAATAVAAYWNERKGGMIFKPSIPGYNTTMAVIALGMAVGGRLAEAETIAERVRSRGEKLAGGMSTWALAHIFDAEGRTAEGISACANHDGIVHYESCGFFLFDLMLSGYGVRFALDREERGRGRSAALRMYDNNFESLLDYSGFSRGMLYKTPMQKAPVGWKRSIFEESNRTKSFMSNFFGSGRESIDSTSHTKYDESQSNNNSSQDIISKPDFSSPSVLNAYNSNWVPTMEDILTWLPPTPQFLAEATLLLLRLTLNGTISCNNYRWENVRNSWMALLQMNEGYSKESGESFALDFCPLACVAASLMLDPSAVGKLSGPDARLAAGLYKMGELLNLADGVVSPSMKNENEYNSDESQEDSQNFLSTILFRDIVADKQPDFWLPVHDEGAREEWRTVLKLLSSAIDGIYDPTGEDDHDILKAELSQGFNGWEFDVRPFLEHAVVYVACKCGDYESLSIARSICSRGVTLRPNSPEEWWRYSIVLGLLGDEVASQDALANSHAVGGGQGIRGDE